MDVRQDLVFGARLLRRSPGFTLTAVLSLAVGIAASTAIFSLADAVLLRPRPGIAEPERLVDVGRSQDGQGFDNLAYPDFADLRDRSTVFAGLAGLLTFPEPMGLGAGDDAVRVYGTPVSAGFFDLLGVRMAVGRGFREDEDRPGAPGVAVLSDRFWRERFDGAAEAVGRTFVLNGRPFVVVGVAPRGFTGTGMAATDLWIPLTAYPATTGRGARLLTAREAVWLQAVGRLKPGVTLAQARAEVGRIARDLEREHPDAARGRGLVLSPSHRVPAEVRGAAVGFAGLLFALVGLVLAIASTNVAGMLLARGVTRGKEIAVRLALGAGRARIVRQLVTESLLLAALGGAAGVLGAIGLIRALRAVLPALPLPLSAAPALDLRVMAFALALALVTGVAFGAVPALHASRADVLPALRADAGARRGPLRFRLRAAFVAGQVALSMLLVACALLIARSLAEAARVEPGFVAADVDVVELDLRLAGYGNDNAARFVADLLDEVRGLPGVSAAASTRVVPLTGMGHGRGRLRADGAAPAAEALRADWSVVSPGYFETLRIPLVRGRDFTPADGPGAPDVAIVNETLARRAWPGLDAVGRSLVQDGARELVVVGVARDGKYRSLDEPPRGFIWVPLAQQPDPTVHLVIRRAGGASAAAAVRDVLRRRDPRLPVVRALTLAEATALGLLPRRIAGAVAGSLGAVGLFLAAIGLYGLTAYGVRQRRREIGIRVAVGARPADVVRSVVGGAARLAGTGALIGLLASWGAAGVIGSVLPGVRGLDAPTFAALGLLFAALALGASGVPAWRAARIRPAEVLRAE